MRSGLATFPALAALALSACTGPTPARPLPTAPAQAAAPASRPPPDRRALNRAALELGLPLHWAADANGNGEVDPEELDVVWGLGPARDRWVANGALTPAFAEAWARVSQRAASPSRPSGPDAPRQEALAREASQSQYVVVASDLRGSSNEDRALVDHLVDAAAVIERLYARQHGTLGMPARIPPDDGLSRLVFYVNQGPWCSAPATEKDPACTALDPRPPRLYGLYPDDLQAKPFCADLQKAPNAKALTDPFTVVVRDAKGALTAVPFHVQWKEDMAGVASHLRAAAAAVKSPEEKPLATYLSAAAKAFLDGSWFEADEAWARMNAENSRWYVRVGPDEVYHEPCNLKAGFHLTLASIDRTSLAWQKRLEPVKAEMERAIAAMAGKPYQARKVTFHLPDFIEIVLNAGDDRSPRGATIGQSLPNFGPVANGGRGRTVAMTNLYQDPESREVSRQRAEAVFCPDVMDDYSDERDPVVMGTVLHEAAHNLGPSHQYAVKGKTAEQIFGGPMASMLEELKAQTSALWLTDWLLARGVVDQPLARKAHVSDLAWTFGQIAQGMYDSEGKMKTYPALAAIQVGALLQAGVMAWRADRTAANGKDPGCISIDMERLPAAVEALERRVLGVKARGDVAEAGKLKADYVDAAGPFEAIRRIIAERYNRWPVATFMYSVRT